MSKFNTSTNHPLIPNSQEYLVYRKIISIHSEDRDIVKFPSSSDFEIELPQDYLNVRAATLSSWTFPANYSTFSLQNRNITMSFQLTPVNPATLSVTNPLQTAIYNALNANVGNDYFIIIETGFYNPDQMATELTNRFNQVVTEYLTKKIDVSYTTQFLEQGGYTDFVIVYNNVAQKLWFGNRSSAFTLTNNIDNSTNFYDTNIYCKQNRLPSFTNWGLPFFLGLTHCPATSVSSDEASPRFYYGDVKPGDNGYWLLPNVNLPSSNVYFLECPQKINLMGASYIYMEIDILNNIDETSPYNLSTFTSTTNQTNGRVNSAFAKIPVPTTPISQWFETEGSESYKIFDPPAERIRRLRIKIRYHDGSPVNFDTFPFSFSLQFTLFNAQKSLGYKLTLI